MALSQFISAEISLSYEGNGHFDKAMLMMSLQLYFFLKYSFCEYGHILYYKRLYLPYINLAKNTAIHISLSRSAIIIIFLYY